MSSIRRMHGIPPFLFSPHTWDDTSYLNPKLRYNKKQYHWTELLLFDMLGYAPS